MVETDKERGMSDREDRLAEFAALLERHAGQDGVNLTGLEDVATFRASQPHSRKPEVYEPAILIMGQGRKVCYLGGRLGSVLNSV
jgi:hypothetical protein